MGVFILQLFAFVIIVGVLVKFVGPPLKKATQKRQSEIQSQIDESEVAKKRLAEAKTAYADAMEQAKAEARKIRDEAREDARSIIEDIRAQADAEVARIKEHGKAQVALNRSALIRSLRAELGLSTVDLAGKLVRDHLDQPGAKSESIDRVIGELEEMAQGSATPSTISSHAEAIGTHTMRATSRESIRALQKAFNDTTASMDSAGLTELSDDLLGVVGALDQHPLLRKHLAEVNDDGGAKGDMIDSLFGGKIGEPAVRIVKVAVNHRWSTARDLSFALERLSRLALLKVAELQGNIDDVEDELFRIGRLLVAQPALTQEVSNPLAPTEGRVQLLDSLLAGKVSDTTRQLVAGAIRTLRGRPADSVVSELADLAAARRGEAVAHVIAATSLTDEQVGRVTQVLGRVYGRPVSTQVEVDPELLGGMRIIIGDEVIEADIATRLAKAAEQLPR